jgi:hypothetical protein
MKTTFRLILVTICIAFLSCQKDENLTISKSSITNGGVLNGKIVNYVINSIDSVKAWNNFFVGTGKVASTGDFSIGLTVPILLKLGTLSGVTISDSTAMTGTVSIFSFLNFYNNGVLSKCNYTADSLNKAGISNSVFIYSDRVVRINGTHTETFTLDNNTQTSNYNVYYNVMIKKGWNELVYKVISNIQTTNSETISGSLTNTITDDLQWHFFNIGYSYVHKELTGKSQQKTEKLFLIR